MNSVSVILREPAWPQLSPEEVLYLQNSHMEIALLKHGTRSGKSTAILRIDLPDGRTVLFETTLALLGTAVDSLRAADEG